jgi:hypothetical protein
MTGDSGCITLNSGVSIPILTKEGIYVIGTAKDFERSTDIDVSFSAQPRKDCLRDVDWKRAGTFLPTNMGVRGVTSTHRVRSLTSRTYNIIWLDTPPRFRKLGGFMCLKHIG